MRVFLGRVHIKNTLHEPLLREIGEGSQSHSDEIMVSNGRSTEKLSQPGLQENQRNFIPSPTDPQFITRLQPQMRLGGNLTLETSLQGINSVRPWQQH